MKIGIMQPYLFPYIGYFQLIKCVDIFILLDDVTFINRGWINRNFIIVNKKKYMFTFSLKNKSQNTLIKDLELFDKKKNSKKFQKLARFSVMKRKDKSMTRFVRWVLQGLEDLADKGLM